MNSSTLINNLLNAINENTASFHVPGHKIGNIYNKYHRNFIENISKIDTTEIPGTDNLHAPKGIIKQAQERAAQFYGADESFFLVNGSTGGIYSMIMAATKPGDKIIVQRDCHKSVINAMILGGLIPIYIKPEVDTNSQLSLGVTPKSMEDALIGHPDATAVIITYPNYYGICGNIEEIVNIVHKHNKIFLVDEAHGAHLRLSEKLPISALDAGADIVVQSTHKTLTSFTQSSMLHIKGNRVNRDKLKFMLSLTQSTSPSYILMASLDMAIEIAIKEGKFLMDKLLGHIHSFKENLEGYKDINILSEDKLQTHEKINIDPTKLVINMKSLGISGTNIEEILRKKYNIQVEMSDAFNILSVTSIGNEKNDFDRLAKALKSIHDDKHIAHKKIEVPQYSFRIPDMKIIPRDALYREKTSKPFDKSSGLISGEYIIPYPPGIPLICPGEVITDEIIEYVKMLKSMEINIVGLSDEKLDMINVIK